MKKRNLFLILIVLVMTGCECEYNLVIDGTTYEEEVIIIGDTTSEINSFKNEWEIPVNKNEYNVTLESDSDIDYEGENYKYKISSNKLRFFYSFSDNQYLNSTAVSKCYNNLSISNYNNTTIISTNSNAECFEQNPPLTKIKINIKVDKKVISNNADKVNGNVYTWNINKENANNKAINLVLSEEETEISKLKKQTSNFVIYIVFGIIILIIILVSKWFNKFKSKNEKIDLDD